MFKRSEDPVRVKARDRLNRLGDAEVLDWADNMGRGIAVALADYRRYRDPSALKEAATGAAQLTGALDVLLNRS